MAQNFYISRTIWLSAFRQLQKPLTLKTGSSTVETVGFINPAGVGSLESYGVAGLVTEADAVLLVKGDENITLNETIAEQDGVAWRITREFAPIPSKTERATLRQFALSTA